MYACLINPELLRVCVCVDSGVPTFFTNLNMNILGESWFGENVCRFHAQPCFVNPEEYVIFALMGFQVLPHLNIDLDNTLVKKFLLKSNLFMHKSVHAHA